MKFEGRGPHGRRVAKVIVLAAGCCPIPLQSARAEEVRAGPKKAEMVQDPQSSVLEQLPDTLATARRRPEPLQRTPISIIALTATDLESRSVTNLRGLQNFVPNLTFAPSQNVGEAAANVFIRGIGQEDFGVGAEGGVAFYVDGVYFARSLGLVMNLTDVGSDRGAPRPPGDFVRQGRHRRRHQRDLRHARARPRV